MGIGEVWSWRRGGVVPDLKGGNDGEWNGTGRRSDGIGKTDRE